MLLKDYPNKEEFTIFFIKLKSIFSSVFAGVPYIQWNDSFECVLTFCKGLHSFIHHLVIHNFVQFSYISRLKFN